MICYPAVGLEGGGGGIMQNLQCFYLRILKSHDLIYLKLKFDSSSILWGGGGGGGEMVDGGSVGGWEFILSEMGYISPFKTCFDENIASILQHTCNYYKNDHFFWIYD